METDIQTMHFHLNDDDQKHFDYHIERLDFAKSYIVHLAFILRKEKRDFSMEARAHLKWGHIDVIKVEDYDLHDGITALFTKLEHKLHKEKERKQEH